MKGNTASLIEVAEILAWLGAACRASPNEDEISYCRPHLVPETSNRDPACRLTYEFSKIGDQSKAVAGNGECWHHLFRNPTIAQGYPIPTRNSEEKGLEVSLNIMSVLGSTPWAIQFDRTLFLKGFSSLFAPMKRIGSSILWHFIANKDGRRISYNQGLSLSPAADTIDWSALEVSRHFVGWTPSVDIFTGTLTYIPTFALF